MDVKTELDYPELMEKTWILTCEDWTNIFKDWIGSQKDIASGILIRTHTDVGSVTFSSLSDKYEMYFKVNLTIPKIKPMTEQQQTMLNNV